MERYKDKESSKHTANSPLCSMCVCVRERETRLPNSSVSKRNLSHQCNKSTNIQQWKQTKGDQQEGNPWKRGMELKGREREVGRESTFRRKV